MRLTALTLLLGGLLPTGLQAQAPNKALEFVKTITAADLEKHLRVLAADDMEGRETGTPGQKRAADYIARQFATEGLKPIVPGADGKLSYSQPFNLYKKTWKELTLTVGGKKLTYPVDFTVNGLVSVPAETAYETVLAGYGITDANYDDYAGIDVKGKAVVLFDGAPTLADGKTLAEAAKWTGNDGLRNKTTLAKDKGAAQIFIVSAESGDGFKQLLAQRSAMMGRFNRLSMKSGAENVGSVGVFIVSQPTGAELLGTTVPKLKKVSEQIGKTGKTAAGSLAGKVSVKAERGEELLPTENVMGYIEGTDKKDEVVIVSAHYDHIGVSANGQVNNGANDDGSGTVSVLEISQAFQEAKNAGSGPRRSLLFLTVTGEEKGLLGSQYYADMSPVLPLANTVCDLNIDMVGRVDDLHHGKADSINYIYAIGSDKLSSDLHKISEATNKQYVNMNLDYKYNEPNDPERIYYRSDHYNFAKNRIPIIFYFNGLHADYHRPTDDVDKINFQLAEKSARLVFLTAWDIANRDERLVVDSNKK